MLFRSARTTSCRSLLPLELRPESSVDEGVVSARRTCRPRDMLCSLVAAESSLPAGPELDLSVWLCRLVRRSSRATIFFSSSRACLLSRSERWTISGDGFGAAGAGFSFGAAGAGAGLSNSSSSFDRMGAGISWSTGLDAPQPMAGLWAAGTVRQPARLGLGGAGAEVK